MILLNKDTKCLVQGITGKQGSFHTEQMLKYDTNIVAGLTPGKGGQDFMGVPIFNSMEEATEEVDVNASIIFVPARFAKDAAFEAIRHLDLVVIISEHIPVHDSMKIMAYAQEMDTTVIGPNTPGIISPGVGKLGIMPVTGSNYVDILERFERDEQTDAVVLIGEIGGNAEERAGKYIAEEMSKPVVSYIAGRTAPPGKRMGHAGAIIQGSSGTVASKTQALNEAGVEVAKKPSEIVDLLKKVM